MLKFPPVQEIWGALTKPARIELAHKDEGLSHLEKRHDPKRLKALRKAFTQAEIAHTHLAVAKKSSAQKTIASFSNLCGDVNDKIRQHGSAGGLAQAAIKAYSRVSPSHLEADKLLGQDEFLQSMRRRRARMTQKAHRSSLSNSQFHDVRCRLRQLMYIHKAVASLEPHTLHDQVYKRLLKVSDRMGSMHDDLIDFKGDNCHMTGSMLKTIRWYSRLSL